MYRKRLTPLIAAVAALALLVSACSSRNAVNKPKAQSGGGKGGYGYTIDVVTHGGAGDAFWSIVKAGALQAGKDMGVKVNYQSDGDPTAQSKLIDAAVNEKPNGLVVSMANPDALKTSVENATKSIPTIVINSGGAQAFQYGALSYIGSDEAVAGRAVGTRLKADGKKSALCIIQEAGNVSLETRCNGVKSTLGGTVTNLQVDNNNLPAALSIIKAKLQSDKSIDAVVTLGAQVASVALQAIQQAGSSAELATFDLNSDVATAVKDGKIAFAVDQQPYLQGYLAVVMLVQYKYNLNVLGGGQAVLTGPSLVTKENAEQVLEYTKRGTR
jgi:simple sugar transport system substrate-binding protein